MSTNTEPNVNRAAPRSSSKSGATNPSKEDRPMTRSQPHPYEHLVPGEPIVIRGVAISDAEWRAQKGTWDEQREVYGLADPRARDLLAAPEPDEGLAGWCPLCHAVHGAGLDAAGVARQRVWLERLGASTAKPHHRAALEALALRFSAEHIVCPACTESAIIWMADLQPASLPAPTDEALPRAA